MAGEWRNMTLGEVLTLQRGFDLPKTKRQPGRYEVIASTGPVGTHFEAKVEGPGVVIGRSGSIGGGQYIEHDFWPLNTTLWVKDFKGNDHRFCYYLLKSLDLGKFNVGSGVPTLNRNHIHPLTVHIPTTLFEQRTITHILGTLDDKIDLNRKMNETLEAVAQALFKSWFVDFDPVIDKALTAGNPLPEELTEKAKRRKQLGDKRKPLPEDIVTLFPDEFEDSELGWIPKGWGSAELGSFSHILNGFAFKSEDYCGSDGIRVLRTKNFNSSGYASKRKDDVYLPSNFLENYSQYICKAFDYHLVMVGASVGKTSLLLPDFLPALRNQNMWCFRPKNNLVSKYYLNYAVRRTVHTVMSWADGSARSFFRKFDFKKQNFLLPTDNLLGIFEDITMNYFTKIATNSSENEKLRIIRDTLLPKLISGELRVPDAVKIVEEIGT